MTKIRIVAAIASEHGVTFYLDNGEELNRPKDSFQTKMILDQTVEALARKEIVEINLDDFSIERRIEERTGGAIRFLKTTTSRLKKLMGMGNASDSVLIGRLERLAAKPADTDTISTRVMDDVTIAVVKTAAGAEVAIPQIQKLDKQMEYAAFESAVGFKAFMDRVAAVAKDRKHTVDELLNFMKKGDLPIADDGSIVAYKMLYSMGNYLVDPHTKKVQQKLGSHVSMPIEIVDESRRQQCSTGLHIARRGYIGNFHGDTIMIVKVAPEDVIAVPHGEPDKMRAAAYHIVGKVPAAGDKLLRQNKPMTSDDESARLLADVIAGNHTKVLEYVRIHGKYGTDVKITPAEGVTFEEIVSSGKKAQALDEVTTTVSLKEIRDRAEAEIVKQKAAVAQNDAQKAAQSGDLSVAVSQPATPAPAPVTPSEPKKAAAKSVKTDKVVEARKPVEKKAKAPAAKQKTPEQEAAQAKAADGLAKPLPAKHAAAIRLHGEGKSNRQIEAELHICRKTLKKLFDKNGLKPNG
ncbi:hypothetical protein B1VFA_003 [Rhizobium phage B1VFA]|nr:hypothetical protein B1VFA_003 [Rhizobium phage B1VFA]